MITVKCIANSYNNSRVGLSLSKGQEAEVEESKVQEAIKTGYLEKVTTPAKKEAEKTVAAKEEEKEKTPPKSRRKTTSK